MNVFVLCTGRTGSVSFIEACSHIDNFTASHESRVEKYGDERLAYPPNHIEADNRLSWFLGRLGEQYRSNVSYVHLRRDIDATARSLVARWDRGIISAYHNGILSRLNGSKLTPDERLAVCRDYCDTVNTNISTFLAGQDRSMIVDLESAPADFARFWDFIGATGDHDAAQASWSEPKNVSRPDEASRLRPELRRIQRLEASLQARDARIERLVGERDGLITRQAETAANADQRVAKVESDRTALKERVGVLLQQVSGLQDAGATRTGRVTRLEEERAALQDRVAALLERVEKLHLAGEARAARVTKLEGERADLHSRLAGLRERDTRRLERIEKLETERDLRNQERGRIRK